MVTRKGDDLNIMIPSITFAPNEANFKGIGEAEKQRNDELFDQIVVILERYKDYSIEISGHAHNVSGTEKENTEELIPLSEKRAQTVKSELAKRGIKEKRMTCVGKGSSEPLAYGSEDVWKNRRVELTLKK
jgi:outer membrane protein OmpA-like peptidoglycan-associated protein